jgi:hypothetical protein
MSGSATRNAGPSSTADALTYRRIAALKTAADFRAHVVTLGVTLPFDETLLRQSPLPHDAAFRYIMRKHSA